MKKIGLWMALITIYAPNVIWGQTSRMVNQHLDEKTKIGKTDEYVIDEFISDNQHFKLYYLDINTEYAEFSPIFYENGIIYCSGYPMESSLSREIIEENSLFLDLYYIDSIGYASHEQYELESVAYIPDFDKEKYRYTKQTGNDSPVIDYTLDSYIPSVDGNYSPFYTRAVKLSENINTGYHEGPASITSDEKTIYFTRNNFHNGELVKGKKNTANLQIFSADMGNDGTWQNVQLLPFNNPSFSTGHPAINAGNDTLYFASNMPGGLGGTDLYMVKRAPGGAWENPKNLGKAINTPGNECFPFLDQHGGLYFSSDGHGGLGELDIFKYRSGKLIRLDEPFNSSANDFGYIISEDATFGYFSSDRKVKDDDDIYYFVSESISMEGVVVDKNSGLPIPEALVEIYDKTGGKPYLTVSVYADEKGYFKAPVKACTKYDIVASKDGYIKESIYQLSQCYESITEPVKLKLGSLRVNVFVYDAISGHPIESAAVHLESTEAIDSYVTDNAGQVQIAHNICEQLRITSIKEGYMENSKLFSTRCDSIGVMNVKLPMKRRKSGMVTVSHIKKATEKNYTVSNKNIIYYDFDKYLLRQSARSQLDNIVRLMKSDPAFIVILNSFTDSKGTESYNDILSQMRTLSAARYLVDSGIPVERITRDWYGEKKLVNGCGNGVDCSAEEHQLNRRTEILLVKEESPRLQTLSKKVGYVAPPDTNKIQNGYSNDWFKRAIQNIDSKQYEFIALNEKNKYIAANVKQRLGFVFNPQGYYVRNILVNDTLTKHWEFNFNFKGISKADHHTIKPVDKVVHRQNNLKYIFPEYTVEYINNEHGMRQNFIVNERLDGSGELMVNIDLSGNLIAKLTDPGRLILHTHGNDQDIKMIFDRIKAWDADGNLLAANMEMAGHNKLSIMVDDSNASYPITIDPLNHTPDWTDSGDGLVFGSLDDSTEGTLYGYSVSGAGDVNNDGYDDIIIGAPRYVEIVSIGGGTYNSVPVGAAFVYYGSPTGPSLSPDEVLQPTSVEDAQFGFSVSNAGDLDGDGFDDVIVGAPGDEIDLTILFITQSVAAGKAYVYYGAAFDNDINTIPAVGHELFLDQADFGILAAAPANPLYGYSVSNAGDVNNDNFDDIVIGAPGYINLIGLSLSGRSDVYYGSGAGLAAVPDQTINGGLANGQFGNSVSDAGDVNNDSFDDIIIGSPGSAGAGGVGAAHIFHGSAAGITATDVPGADNTLQQPSLVGQTIFGYSVSRAGDVNNDGFDDVLVGEPLALENFSGDIIAVGKTYIFYGSAGGVITGGSTLLTSPRSPALVGSSEGNTLFGFSLSNMGDINCDGVDDIIIGEPGGTAIALGFGLLGLVSTHASEGSVYIYYGVAGSGPVNAPSWTLSETGSVATADLLGSSVSNGGDINGDGIPDYLVGAPNGTIDLGTSIVGNVGNSLPVQTLNSEGFAYGFYDSNEAPVAVDNAFNANEDNDATGDVVANDTDTEGPVDPATVDLDPSTPGIQNTRSTPEGDWSVDATGEVTFTPAADYNGVATISYTVNDLCGIPSNLAFISAIIAAVNDPPVANDDNETTDEDTDVIIDVTSNDTDVDGTINAGTVDLNAVTPGIQNSTTTPEGSWTVDASGMVTFSPVANYNGMASTTYTVNDNNGLTSNLATITITINSVNNPPVAVDDNTSMDEDMSVMIDVTTNDYDIDGTIEVNTVDLDPGTPGIQTNLTTSEGDWSVDITGTVTFIPIADFNGLATTVYTINDDLGATSNEATINITVNSINDPPVAVDDVSATVKNYDILVDVTANDYDIDGIIDVTTVDMDPVTPGVQNNIATPEGSWTADLSGMVTFSPVTDFTGVAAATYLVMDDSGDVTNIANITITVNAVNTPPVAVDDNAITDEDLAITIDVTMNDYDPDGTIDVSSVDLDPLTAGAQTNVFTLEGTWSVDNSGLVTFAPTPEFSGIASITYTVVDNIGALSNEAIITITINTINDPPVAVDDAAVTNQNVMVDIDVTDNDYDVDGIIVVLTVDLDPVSAGIQNNISNTDGTWAVDLSGMVTFTPSQGFSGLTTLNYTVNDDNGTTSNEATITVEVIPENETLVVLNDTVYTTMNFPVDGNIILNDQDPGGGVLSVNINAIYWPLHGTINMNADGNFSYQPDEGYIGIDSVVFEVCDDGNPGPVTCAQNTLFIVVDPADVVNFFIPEGFSPNNDGVNDNFVITYTGSERISIEVYNRWGNLVYLNFDYRNDWNGIANKGLKFGELLPDGTYFYKIDIGDVTWVRSLTLHR